MQHELSYGPIKLVRDVAYLCKSDYHLAVEGHTSSPALGLHRIADRSTYEANPSPTPINTPNVTLSPILYLAVDQLGNMPYQRIRARYVRASVFLVNYSTSRSGSQVWEAIHIGYQGHHRYPDRGQCEAMLSRAETHGARLRCLTARNHIATADTQKSTTSDKLQPSAVLSGPDTQPHEEPSSNTAICDTAMGGSLCLRISMMTYIYTSCTFAMCIYLPFLVCGNRLRCKTCLGRM